MRLRLALPCAFGLVAAPAIASAHIHLTSPRHRTDSPTGDQKAEHCGTPGWVRADHPDRIAYFQPGQTITVSWDETIQHPGYFRIALQPEGEVFSIPLCGDGTEGPNCGTANFPTENLTGMIDVAGAHVLADQILDGTLTQTVTLPAIECANCTLQFIQVMTDKDPYTRDALSDDIYFNCADVVLSNSAPPPDAATGDAGGNPAGGDAGGGGGVSGGCSAGGGSPSGILTVLSLVWLLRRRTSRRA